MTIAAALATAAVRLAHASETPRLDAELLMAHVCGVSREDLLLRRLDDPVPEGFVPLVERRLRHEPVAYLTGTRDFWTITLAVTPAVLIPRPDTETLIEAALDHFGARGPDTVLDLGTGSGALLLAALAEWPSARGLGVDASEGALAVAGSNATALGFGSRASFVRGGWDHAAAGTHQLVLCNPPYIAEGAPLPPDVLAFEPASALFAGADGLDDYRAIAPLLRLPDGGLACLEIGSDQGEAVCALFAHEGFVTDIRRDLAGHDRCVLIRPGP